MQSLSISLKAFLMMRSSSDWNVMTPTRPHFQVGNAGFHRVLQDPQLVIYLDADRLKCALRRMRAISSGMRRNGRLDGRDQIICRLDGLLLAEFTDKLRDPLRPSLLPILPDDARKLFLFIRIHDLIRRARIPLIHAHIELPIIHIREATAAVIELMG